MRKSAVISLNVAPDDLVVLRATGYDNAQADGAPLIASNRLTVAGLARQHGYRTAAIGKWHLGFGRGAEPDYNPELKPGPLEIGFDYFFGCPRTLNEPPFVFVENRRMVGADPADPIRIVPHEEVVKRGLKDCAGRGCRGPFA